MSSAYTKDDAQGPVYTGQAQMGQVIFSAPGKVRTSITAGTDSQSFINFLHSQLTDCGWITLAVVDGYSGTHGYKMESAASPFSGTSMRVTFWLERPNNPFDGYQIYFAFSDQSETYYSGIKGIGGTFGTLTIQPHSLNGIYKRFKIYSGPYQVFIRAEEDYISTGGSGGLTNQNSIHWGIPVIFDSTQPAWWAKWEGNNADTFVRRLCPSRANYTCSYYINGIYSVGQWMGSGDPFSPQLLTFRQHTCYNTVVFQPVIGSEDRYPIILPRLITGIKGSGIVTACPLWDSFVACGYYKDHVQTYIDGRQWEAYGISDPLGSLFLLLGPQSTNTQIPGYAH